MVPGERTRKSMGSSAGGGGVGVGVDAGGVGLEGARDLPDKKKLQRKSVSFTGEEGYQVRPRLLFSFAACAGGRAGVRASFVVVVVASAFVFVWLFVPVCVVCSCLCCFSVTETLLLLLLLLFRGLMRAFR